MHSNDYLRKLNLYECQTWLAIFYQDFYDYSSRALQFGEH